MKLLHLSDTHLGFNDLDLLNDAGINRREADFYDAFAQVIDAALTCKPDYVIHTGDLFHRPHPSNRAISFALTQLKRLSAAKINTVIIAGNHSTPRTKAASPILAALGTLDYVFPVFEEAYERVVFDDVVFHAIPHIHDDAAFIAAIDEVVVDESKRNVLMLHCSVGAHYLMEEYGERVYPKEKEALFSQMDYVALGHWHGFGKVGKHPNVYYAGSTERTSGSDGRNDKGYALITLGESLHVSFEPIAIRPSYRIVVDARNDIAAQLEAFEPDTSGALLHVSLENLSVTQSIDIANSDIEAFFPEALHVTIQRRFSAREGGTAYEEVNATSLQEYFEGFLKEQSRDEAEFERLHVKVETLFGAYDEVTRDS